MNLDILAFGAHPDDVELSASGTILKQISFGHTVGIVDLTQGELGSRGTVETRYEEAKMSAEILGISYRENLKMKDGWFEINNENLKKIIVQIRKFRPKIILCNAPSDRHPDHGRASELVSRASFLSGLSKIKTYYNKFEQDHYRPNVLYKYIQDYYLKPDFCVDISKFIDKKIESIMAFKTQFYNPESNEPTTPISSKSFLEFIKARMINFGRPIGSDYAEGFLCERFIGIDDLFHLK